MVGGSCLGFRELFELARGRPWTCAEEASFRELDQPARNALVRLLAAQAGGVQTEDRVGTDGVVYTAFWLCQSPSPGADRHG